MATTNLINWNPTAVNQETDAQYLADSQRAGGATNPSLFDATLANKAFYQWSTYLTALFQAFANKGFTTSDSNLSTLTAQCANFLTTADTQTQIVPVAYSATPTFDCSASNGFQMTLSGNVTGITISNVAPGQLVAFYFLQDSSGSRTIGGWPSLVTATGPIPQPDPTPGQDTIYLFRAELTGHLHLIGPPTSGLGSYFNSATVTANFTVDGTSTLNNVNVEGNEVVEGTLNVDGGLFANAGLNVNGGASVTGNVTAGGVIATNTQTNNNANVVGNLTAGSITSNGSTVNGNEHVTGALTVNGVADFTNNAVVGGSLTVSGSETVSSNLQVNGTANVGALQIGGGAINGYVLTGNGTDYVPVAPPAAGITRSALVTNGNGSYYQWSDGVKEAWGIVSVPPSGNQFNAVSFSFPVAFSSNPSLVLNTNGIPSGSETNIPLAVEIETLSTSGATAYMCKVAVAGGGSGNITNTITLNWRAIGV